MKDLESNQFYHAGKRARSKGLPRTIDDGRLLPDSREAWKAGWDWQDAWMNRPEETEEEAALRKIEVAEECEKMKKALLSL